ncbi:hypothetical protein [Sutcliffiella deserti]|uniref:hypothetical protein n=1 Tax=Sutcliffiella deserti TaxID=2875501 RepID=UPI001CBB2D6C|nr:hypothetical protein [Sutcliffiella deserti]
MARKNRAVNMDELKKKGFELEQQLNALIQNQLNSEDIARYAGIGSDLLAKRMHSVKEDVERLSLQYNFPTKNDVANLARLMIQIEEKIDSLEVQLNTVSRKIEHLNKKVNTLSDNKKQGIPSSRLQTKEGSVVLSRTPGEESKVMQLERWLHL